MWQRLNSLQTRLALLLLAAAVIGALVYVGIVQWPLPQLVAWLRSELAIPLRAPTQLGRYGGFVASVAVLLPLAWWLAHRAMAPINKLLRALEGAVASYRDGDFSFSIAARRGDELGQLIRMHNALGQTLREERQHLAQRELLLETVVQNTPVALVLTDAGGRVAYANLASRHLFNEGKSLGGLDFAALLETAPEALRQAVAGGKDALISVEMDGGEETFHLSQRAFRLQGRPHRLHLFRRMTRELSRQEVATWKRVIRVISHELNNSLAPISSLAHSGAELARRGDLERLPGVFATIGERARHLHGFIAGYASFAKLPAPRQVEVAWVPFLEALALHCRFHLQGGAPGRPGWFDPAQVEQVLINLVKNAHEAGGPPDAVQLALRDVGSELYIEVMDRGPGMSETVLAQALLPFYSTKRAGTGLGLALAREIAEAHGGRVQLANREGGGLRVSLRLPWPATH
jgi:nitrogen fixation/metabolism regulation signal transduction histidine kinase